MASETALQVRNGLQFDRALLEEIILSLGDRYHVRIVWDSDTALLTAGFAVAGGLLGGYYGGRLGAAIGGGVGGVCGLGVTAVLSLRELWSLVKDQLQELCYLVYNHLRRLDAMDYVDAARLLYQFRASRIDLVFTLLDFIATKIGRTVISSLTAA